MSRHPSERGPRILAALPCAELDTATADAPEEVLLDENEEAKRSEFYMTAGVVASPNHK